MNPDSFAAAVVDWYDGNARDLPWRQRGVTPWGVLVSEVMLQQTPATRVVPAWLAWMQRWPAAARLAAASPGDAVRQWDRLGYPRRALRLHATAVAIVERHSGEVPARYDDLLALPGIGGYTAAAVAAFGFGQRQPVLDTNVRRVYSRVYAGVAGVRTASPTVGERAAALSRLPIEHPARYSVAVMELGAVVCTARSPRCPACPVTAGCAWHAAGRPPAEAPRQPQRYAGTDRQVRGRLLAVLRNAADAVRPDSLEAVWDDPVQRGRALAGLLADGLVERVDDGCYRLPG